MCSDYLIFADSHVLANLPILVPLYDSPEGKMPLRQTSSNHCATGESDGCHCTLFLPHASYTGCTTLKFTASAGFLSVALGALFMSGSGLFISLFRHHIGPLFVDDLSVTQQVARVAPICAAYQVFDGIAGTSSGVLRCGMPSASAHSAACCAAQRSLPW